MQASEYVKYLRQDMNEQLVTLLEEANLSVKEKLTLLREVIDILAGMSEKEWEELHDKPTENSLEQVLSFHHMIAMVIIAAANRQKEVEFNKEDVTTLEEVTPAE